MALNQIGGGRFSAIAASSNNYDELFGGRTLLEADAVTGSKNSNGEQIRMGVGNDTLGLAVAGLQFKSDGFAQFENLDNRVAQATVQWHPTQSTQAFVSSQAFDSRRGETFLPAAPWRGHVAIKDHCQVTRLGLRYSLTGDSELRTLWSTQRTDQVNDYYDFAVPSNYTFSTTGNSNAHGAELQYRRTGATYATQWGVQKFRGRSIYLGGSDLTRNRQQLYAAWQQALNREWQLDAGLGFGKIDNQDNVMVGGFDNSTSLARWLPRLGAVYTPDSVTHLRMAAWQSMGMGGVGDATLVPTSLAGILLNRYGDDGKLVRGASLGANRQLSPAWLLAAEAQRRKTGLPNVDPFSRPGEQFFIMQQVDESRLELHWQPDGKPWAVKFAYDYEHIQNEPNLTYSAENDSVNEQNLRSQQIEMRWFASAQWTAHLAWSHNRVNGTQIAFDPFFAPIPLAYQNGFNQLDANLDWQFAKSGTLAAGVRNAADKRFQYMDIDRLNPRFSNGRMVYARIKFAW